MTRYNINTGLENFRLIDRITEFNDEEIHGSITFNDAPPFLCIESLAQLGAMHARQLVEFEKHAALLKIDNFKIIDNSRINGKCLIHATVAGKSGRAISYSVKATMNNKTMAQGSITIALIDYDDNFKNESLMNHYRELFSCLIKD